MRVLFLTAQLPYPPVSGGVIKSLKLIEFLSSFCQLTLGCLLKSIEDKNHLTAFKKHMPQLDMFFEASMIPRTPVNLLKSYFTGIPLTVYRNRCDSFKRQLASRSDNYDVIFVDHYLMFQYVPINYLGRVIVHQHNAEFVIWSRLAKQSINPIKRVLLSVEACRIKKYELTMCRLADVVLAAPNDISELIAVGAMADKFIDTYHLGDEENLNLPPIVFEKTELKVLFVGSLTWEPNIDGLLWFLKNSWPLIKQSVPCVTFTIVGRHSQKLKTQILKLEPEARLLGFLNDLDDLYRYHRVFVAPTRFGSGIKVKVVNSLYRGLPTVTTTIGVEGLKLKNHEHILIQDNAADFADSVVSLLKDKVLWRTLSCQSRAMMLQNYTWSMVFSNVRRSFDNE